MKRYSKAFDMSGKNAVVIGAASGIGQQGAYGLAAAGAHVWCADLNEAGAQESAAWVRQRGGAAESARVDIADAASVKGLFEDFAQGLSLDAVVVTPAINVRKPLLQMSDEEFDRVVQLNLHGTFRVLREAGRRMSEQGSGSLIALSSIRSHVVEPGQGVYAATKAGILQMVRALAAELGPRGVRVNAIAPGVVETPLTEQIKDQPDWYNAYANKNALGRWAKSSELAGPIVFLASEAASYVTGSLLLVDAGWTAIDGRFTPPL